MNIEFGCGPNVTEGYVGCDIQPYKNVDYVCNAWEITEFVGPKTVDKIYSRHFLEHLTFERGRQTIEAWSTILKSTGTCEIILPNMDVHAQQWLDGQHSPAVLAHASAGFWGWQRSGGAEWDLHKSGYNFNTLAKLLTTYNFHSIEEQHTLPNFHLHVICKV